jgi:hypothetical protein
MNSSQININNFSFYSAYYHFSTRLKERFNADITYEDFVKSYVLKRTLPKKYHNKKIKYIINDKMIVYHVLKYFEVPITVYEVNRINKNKAIKTINPC